jgi:hypothetical protein
MVAEYTDSDEPRDGSALYECTTFQTNVVWREGGRTGNLRYPDRELELLSRSVLLK